MISEKYFLYLSLGPSISFDGSLEGSFHMTPLNQLAEAFTFWKVVFDLGRVLGNERNLKVHVVPLAVLKSKTKFSAKTIPPSPNHLFCIYLSMKVVYRKHSFSRQWMISVTVFS